MVLHHPTPGGQVPSHIQIEDRMQTGEKCIYQCQDHQSYADALPRQAKSPAPHCPQLALYGRPELLGFTLMDRPSRSSPQLTISSRHILAETFLEYPDSPI